MNGALSNAWGSIEGLASVFLQGRSAEKVAKANARAAQENTNQLRAAADAALSQRGQLLQYAAYAAVGVVGLVFVWRAFK